MSIDNRLLLLNDSGDDTRFWYQHNATQSSFEDNPNAGTTGTMFFLVFVIFFLFTCTLVYVQYETVKHENERNSASDGKTVASREDDDIEEGPSKPCEDTSHKGPMVIVIRVNG